MQDKWLVGVCNLKPASMRGVKSFAMVLCATSKDGKEAGIEVIDPPPNSKPGERIYFEGAVFEGTLIQCLSLATVYRPLCRQAATIAAQSQEEDLRDDTAWYVPISTIVCGT